jgi:hypothetical protein
MRHKVGMTRALIRWLTRVAQEARLRHHQHRSITHHRLPLARHLHLVHPLAAVVVVAWVGVMQAKSWVSKKL